MAIKQRVHLDTIRENLTIIRKMRNVRYVRWFGEFAAYSASEVHNCLRLLSARPSFVYLFL